GRLKTEIEAVAQLHHPNIVDVYDFGELDSASFIAREYVEGDTLARRLTAPALPVEQIAALVETLARAVHEAHVRGIVHGNVKPSKVLLKTDGTCKISGFGLAELWRNTPYAGLSNYMAPEQAEARAAALTPATDVYALGAVLYELLCGRPAVLSDSVQETLEQLRRSEPKPPRQLRQEVPADMEAICLKC